MSNVHIDTFVDTLIDEKGLNNLTHEMREDVATDIKKRLDEFIMVRSLAQFSEEELKQFKQLLDEKRTRAELQQFAMEHVADYQNFLSDTILQFREAYLS